MYGCPGMSNVMYGDDRRSCLSRTLSLGRLYHFKVKYEDRLAAAHFASHLPLFFRYIRGDSSARGENALLTSSHNNRQHLLSTMLTFENSKKSDVQFTTYIRPGSDGLAMLFAAYDPNFFVFPEPSIFNFLSQYSYRSVQQLSLRTYE